MRLTEYLSDGTAVARCGDSFVDVSYIGEPNGVYFGNVIDKLAAYEDAEEHGLLVRLPCKVGDTIYEIDLPEYGVIVCSVLCFTYGRSNITRELTWCVTVEVIEGHGLGSCYTFDQDDFGKTVFFTREEAEAALKGEQNDPAEEGE